MIVEIAERVMTYRAGQLRAWKAGDKSITPSFAEVPGIVRNQPAYHFAEMLVLRRYHELEGWLGYASYALGPQYPRSERRLAGRLQVAHVVPASKLAELRALRSDPVVARTGCGEPDLFLYKQDGSFKFVEVKKGSDRLRTPQLTCIAQLLAILCCDVDIVYLREETAHRRAKVYRFDLGRLTGEEARPGRLTTGRN